MSKRRINSLSKVTSAALFALATRDVALAFVPRITSVSVRSTSSQCDGGFMSKFASTASRCGVPLRMASTIAPHPPPRVLRPTPPPAAETQEQRTLYQVLRSEPTATRAELKRQYVALAKLSHPDANIGIGSIIGRGASSRALDFTEIASAYEVLSDPASRRRYDRKLAAEQFQRRVEDVTSDLAGDLGRIAVSLPRVTRLIGRAVAPMARRAAVTVSAATTAATEATMAELGFNGSGSAGGVDFDVGRVVESVMKAVRDAGRAVDRLEDIERTREHRCRQQESASTSSSKRSSGVSTVSAPAVSVTSPSTHDSYGPNVPTVHDAESDGAAVAGQFALLAVLTAVGIKFAPEILNMIGSGLLATIGIHIVTQPSYSAATSSQQEKAHQQATVSRSSL